jgi:hypothetical protein
MQRFGSYYAQDWYVTLTQWQKELVRTSLELLAREERMNSNFADYSFIVFPMAKAYEGFLKDFFLKIGLINQQTYTDKRFRIGKAINPDISPSHRDNEWLYDEIAHMCGPELSREMWNTWLECRNQLFHYFPGNEKRIVLSEAERKIEMIANMMNGMTRCKMLGQASTK